MELPSLSRWEVVFAVLLFVMSSAYLLFAGIQFNDNYSRIYQSVLFVSGVLLALALLRQFGSSSIPAGLIGLGSPTKQFMGIPWVIVGGAVGILAIFFLRMNGGFAWAQLPPVGATVGANDLAQLSIGASLFEESLVGGILLPTWFLIFSMLGIVGALIAFSLMLAFVVGFEYYYVLILAVGVAIFLARSGIANKFGSTVSLLAAMVLNAAFFGILHLKMSGGSFEYAQSAAFFRILMDSLVIFFGLGASIVAHAFNNGMTFGNDPTVGLTVALIIGAVVFGYTQIARR